MISPNGAFSEEELAAMESRHREAVETYPRTFGGDDGAPPSG